MGSVGIIAEYNPFHNGHLYHLNKVREMFPEDTIVLILTSNFSQRGEPSIIDKFKKTEISLKMGIDLVIELPFVFSVQSADFFANASVSMLEYLGVEKFVFGSETNDIDKIITLVDTQLHNEQFDSLVKIYLKMGYNYPTSLSNALRDLTEKDMRLPNDLLGISYVKSIRKNNYKIKPLCIERTNDYHGKDIYDEISSASAIREAIKNNLDISHTVPEEVLPYLNGDLFLTEDYFKFLKYKILTDVNLDQYHSVDEGIDKKMKNCIVEATSFEDLIFKLKSKRYTYNRIHRMLTHILCSFTKEEAENMKEIEYIRVLGFSNSGRSFLNKVKKDCKVPIISKFSKNQSSMLDLELRATSVYVSILDEDKKKELIEKEYKFSPIVYNK